MYISFLVVPLNVSLVFNQGSHWPENLEKSGRKNVVKKSQGIYFAC